MCMSFQGDNTEVTIMSHFTPIFNQLQQLKTLQPYMVEKKDGYKTDGGFSSGLKLLHEQFRSLCQQFKASAVFNNICTTNNEFRDNVYKHSLAYEIDEIMVGRFGDYMACNYPLASGSIASTPEMIGCDYTVSWRGLFTSEVDIMTYDD